MTVSKYRGKDEIEGIGTFSLVLEALDLNCNKLQEKIGEMCKCILNFSYTAIRIVKDQKR